MVGPVPVVSVLVGLIMTMATNGAAAAVVAVSARVGAAGESGLNNSSGTLEDMPLQTVARNWSADCPSMERPDGLTGTYKVETASDTLR